MSPTGGERDSGNGRPHVLILGGGFAGLCAARALAGTPVRLTLIDRKNHHLFQPLLYQVATAGLAAPSIAEPIRRVLRKQKNATVLLGEARSIDVERQAVLVDDEELGYDYLIVATGSESHYSGHDEWQKTAPGLKSVEDAFEIRRRVLLAFEAAERERDPALRREWLTFVIVGGGPTGVELAGALREIATRTLASDFRHFDSRSTRVVLLDAANRILPSFPERLSVRAAEMLRSRGVEIRTGASVTRIDEGGVEIRGGEPFRRANRPLGRWSLRISVGREPRGSARPGRAGARRTGSVDPGTSRGARHG